MYVTLNKHIYMIIFMELTMALINYLAHSISQVIFSQNRGLSIYLVICLTIVLSMYLFIYLCIYLSIYVYMYLSIYLSIVLKIFP